MCRTAVVLSFKLGLVLLCRGPLLEKYSGMIKLVAVGEIARLDQRRLGLLLYDIVMVPRYLGGDCTVWRV